MYKIVLSYAIRNITRNKLRSLFTIITVGLIINLYTILASIANIAISELPELVDRAKIDVLIQSKFSSNPLSSSIPMSKLDELLKNSDIKYCNSLIVGKKKISKQASVFIMGMQDPLSFANRAGISIVKGRVFSAEKHNEVIIGSKLAKVMKYKIGDMIELGVDKQYKVVGIYTTWISFLNSSLFIYLNEAQQILNKNKQISILFVSLNKNIDKNEFIKSFNLNNKRLEATVSGDLVQNFTSIKNIGLLINAITMITLAIAVAVMINTFIMATTERTKEIGILSAIGWSKTQIIVIFIVEAILLSYLSAIIGFLSTYPTLIFMQSHFISLHTYLPSSPEFSVIPTLALTITVVGVISALFPALYATKIEISKAFRYE